jgi:predicted acyltransferase
MSSPTSNLRFQCPPELHSSSCHAIKKKQPHQLTAVTWGGLCAMHAILANGFLLIVGCSLPAWFIWCYELQANMIFRFYGRCAKGSYAGD